MPKTPGEMIATIKANLPAKTGKTFNVSDSSGCPIAFGTTHTGRFIAVVFEVLNVADPLVIRPITTYDVPETKE